MSVKAISPPPLYADMSAKIFSCRNYMFLKRERPETDDFVIKKIWLWRNNNLNKQRKFLCILLHFRTFQAFLIFPLKNSHILSLPPLMNVSFVGRLPLVYIVVWFLCIFTVKWFEAQKRGSEITGWSTFLRQIKQIMEQSLTKNHPWSSLLFICVQKD